MEIKDLTVKIQVWEKWQQRYKEFVPKFINEAINKASWQDWDEDVFSEFFEKSNDQCVASLRQKYFDKDEKVNIKANWNEFAPLLKIIAENQDEPQYELYHQLKAIIRKYTIDNKMAATNRMIASIQPNLLCSIVNEAKLKHLMSILNKKIDTCNFTIDGDWFKNSVRVLEYFRNNLEITDPYALITYPWQTYELLQENISEIKDNDMSETVFNNYSKELDILKFKKQIILQGPPGTGKTRLAKEIAKKLILEEEPRVGKTELTEAMIRKYLRPEQKLKSAKGGVDYEIKELTDSGVSVIAPTGNAYVPMYKEIIKAYDNEVWEKIGEITKGNDTYSAAVAKYLHSIIEKAPFKLKESDQFKILQFHPSYSYEDFVRGIVASPSEDGHGVRYKAEDKIFAEFANLALDNYLGSKGESRHDLTFQVKLTALIENIRVKIDSGSEYPFGDKSTGQIIAIKEDGFVYTFPTRPEIKYTVLFSDLEKVYAVRDNISKPIDLRDLQLQIGLGMKGKYPYYYMLLRQLESLPGVGIINSKQTELRNFVLVIDEINRANLSTVLGELIYALEYRGEKVDSMYQVDGNNKLVLPPNLYIIGTMNTADRSVGHIDYAIRRRFAFVDVLPKILTDLTDGKFATALFKTVSSLFIKDFKEDIDYSMMVGNIEASNHLSGDFNPEDVWIGHSYFIYNQEEEMALRWTYEIRPILLEYIKDGVLKESAKKAINEIEVY